MTKRLSILVAFLIAIAVNFLPVRAEAAAPATQPSTAALPARAAVVTIDGEIDAYAFDSLKSQIAKARTAGAKVVIVRIDTWGGIVTAALDISRFLKNQTDLHTIAYVDSKAISAGALIAIACNEIVMTPSGTLGDCAPIQIRDDGKMQSMEKTERQKAESPILADFTESARRNGYNELLVTAMVSLPVSVRWVENEQGERRFVTEAEYTSLTANGWKPVAGVPNPVDSAETLLTVDTQLAIKYGLAKESAPTTAALAASRNYTIVADLTPGSGARIVAFLSNPWLRTILLAIFVNALFISLQSPGHGAPEAITVITLAILIGAPFLTGRAEWWEMAMILGGLALVAFEIFVFPGHSVSLISGALLMVAGLILTFVGDLSLPGAWSLSSTWSDLQRGLYSVTGGLLVALLIFSWLRTFLPKMPFFNRLVLTTTSGMLPVSAMQPKRAEDYDEAHDHWPFVGTIGVATTDLRPGGKVRFPYGADVRIADVVSEAGYVSAGTKVAVREVEGVRVVVRPAQRDAGD